MIGHHAFRGMKALAFALAFTTVTAAAQADTKIKLVLNWKYEGPQGMFFLAQDRGYFKAGRPRRHLRSGQRFRRGGAAGRQRRL